MYLDQSICAILPIYVTIAPPPSTEQVKPCLGETGKTILALKPMRTPQHVKTESTKPQKSKAAEILTGGRVQECKYNCLLSPQLVHHQDSLLLLLLLHPLMKASCSALQLSSLCGSSSAETHLLQHRNAPQSNLKALSRWPVHCYIIHFCQRPVYTRLFTHPDMTKRQTQTDKQTDKQTDRYYL